MKAYIDENMVVVAVSDMLLENNYSVIEIPEGLDPDCIAVFNSDGVLKLVEDSDLVAAKAATAKSALVTAAYNAMNTDVYTQMAAVFGTTNPDSATAFYESWKLMAADPSIFSGQGLTADMTVTGFSIGTPLDTDLKVQAYANACLAGANTYSVYRMKRISQFKVERAAILA